jgi:hypothetical protein
MLTSEHCLRRAERLRTLLLCTGNPETGMRVRQAIAKYRALADRSKAAGSLTELEAPEPAPFANDNAGVRPAPSQCDFAET